MNGTQIKEEIRAAGFKVKQVAVEMGITDIYLYKILRSTNVSEKQVLKIRNAIAKLHESAEPHIRTDCSFLKLKKGEREKHSCIALSVFNIANSQYRYVKSRNQHGKQAQGVLQHHKRVCL